MNVRHIIYKSLLLLAGATLTASCSQMHEDLDDCPRGLYVNFVYDYNIQRADMFKDHVGSVMLYVYDESDHLVVKREVSGDQLAQYGFNIHFTEQELAPNHQYRLQAVAMQRDWNTQAALTSGARYHRTDMTTGDVRSTFTVELAHESQPLSTATTASPLYPVSNAAPLDTLWHTLGTLTATAANRPAATRHHLLTDGTASTNTQQTVNVLKDEPTYATVSLIRDTNHLNISLRELDSPETVNHEDYDVFIVDANTIVDCDNRVVAPADSVVYRPYAQWTTTVEGNGRIATDRSAHYDLMFNRLMYNPTANDNAMLCIRNRNTGENIAMLNLPYILCQGRMAYEIYAYTPQEYLDREYDYRLELFLKNGRWETGCFISVCIDVLSWAKRIQYVEF